jgi:hypothetical protein
MLEQKIAYGCCLFNPLPNAWFRKKKILDFSYFSHQIFVLGIRGLGGHICKKNE